MINIIGDTDKGNVRAQNQDCFSHRTFSDELAYVIVCDGMGGERAGNVASAAVTRIMCEALDRELSSGMPQGSIKRILESAVSTTNIRVYDMARANPEYDGMGTTMDAVVLCKDTASIMHVGDSRVYSYEAGRLTQLTRDHTVVQMLLENGRIKPEDAKVHPKKHMITRAMGVSPNVYTDYDEHRLRGDMALVICSDGLSNYLEPDSADIIEECMRHKSVKPLIDFALSKGGVDNVTAVIVWLSKE